jgi:cysteinyl-tRNA synthetase
LIFPHHENEIAQSEAYLDTDQFSRYWVHNGLLQLGGEKMSKSIGNLVPIEELIARKRAAAFRLLVLQSHYRAPLTYTDEGLEAAHRGMDRFRAALDESVSAAEPVSLEASVVPDTVDQFERAMDDDFDTPQAISALFNLARAINRSAGHPDSSGDVMQAREELRRLLEILGIRPELDQAGSEFDGAPFVDLLLQVREELRSARLWHHADSIRAGLAELGITIADGPEGATWKRET